MKHSLTILLILFCLQSQATDYYFSNAGSDGNSGTQASPYQTLAKVNSLQSSLAAGDRILFKRGDVFYGTITIGKSGASGNPIIYSAYGSGAKPIITGFTSVVSWYNVSGNIWESLNAVSTLSYTNMVLVGGVNTAMGRTPNTGYYTYQSYSTNTSITSSSVNSGTTNWTGAEAVIRKTNYILDRTTITGHSGSTITYDDNVTTDNATNNFGFFIQNDIRTLDQQGEWYFNPSSKTISVYSTTSPTTVQVATVADLVTNNGKDYITIQDLSFVGASHDCISLTGTTDYITIQNCDISYAGNDGIETIGGNGNIITGNSITDCGKAGIFKGGSNGTITYNTIRNCGIIPGLADNGGQGDCIMVYEQNGCLIQYNDLKNSGCHGIQVSSAVQNIRIENNLVDSSVLVLNDNGGIYLGGGGTTGMRYVKDNIVLNTIGNIDGATGNVMAEGIYLDESAKHVAVTGNTVAYSGTSGIKIHISSANRVDSNLFYLNVKQGIRIQDERNPATVINDTIRYNTFISQSTAWVGSITSVTGGISTMGMFDNNSYIREGNSIIFETESPSYVTKTFPAWKTFSGFDANSTSSTTGVDRFEYNETNSAKVVPLDFKYIDVRSSTEYNTGIITLQPYTSAVLIKNGSLDPIAPPTVNAGTDKTITTSTTSLSGTVTPASGYAATYLWTKISGTGGTITNSTTLTPSLSGLTTGTYVYRLTATQNDGDSQTAYDEITVTVSIPVIDPPTVSVESDKTVNTSTTTLTGTATAASGETITSTTWSKTSGGSAGISGAGSLTASINGLSNGTYVFRLTAIQSDSQTAFDEVSVTVAIPLPPTVSAGTDKTISTSTTSLAGTAVPASGYTITSTVWTKISGTGTIASGSTTLTPSLSGLSGTSVYRLTVTQSDGQTSFDEVSVTVVIPLDPPTVDAGSDKTVTVSNTTLTGSASAASGATITSYSWTKTSGTGGSIVNQTTLSPSLSGLTNGTYVYRLTVTQSDGQVSFDEVTVTVSIAPPTVNAGADRAVTVNNTIITASATPASGETIITYSWTKISGTGILSGSNTATLSLTNLGAGVSTYRLTVTQSDGQTAFDDITVTYNIPPTVPSSTQTIQLPGNYILINK